MSEVEQIDQIEAKGRDPLVLLYEVRCHYRSCPRYQCVCACACCDIGVLYAHMLLVRYQMLSFVYNIYVVSSVHIYLFVVLMTIACFDTSLLLVTWVKYRCIHIHRYDVISRVKEACKELKSHNWKKSHERHTQSLAIPDAFATGKSTD